MFFCIVSMVLVLWGVTVFLENECGIQELNYVAWLQGSKIRVLIKDFVIKLYSVLV